MKTYTIAPKTEKGRSFSADLVAVVTADQLFPEYSSETIRPVWSMWAGSEASLKPFTANLRLGAKADPPNGAKAYNRLEFLKSTRFHLFHQKEPEGTLATFYHPDLFCLDPGMVDPDVAKFILLPTTTWEDAQKVDTREAVAHCLDLGYPLTIDELEALAKVSYLFAVFLDRRTRMPLLADPKFYLQLLCACLRAGLASRPGTSLKGYGYQEWDRQIRGFNQEGLGDVGIKTPLCFLANHIQLEALLIEQVKIFRTKAK